MRQTDSLSKIERREINRIKKSREKLQRAHRRQRREKKHAVFNSMYRGW